jgi:hypothetical protein
MIGFALPDPRHPCDSWFPDVAMSVSLPKARIFGGEAAGISQRVEDNAFHLHEAACASQSVISASSVVLI